MKKSSRSNELASTKKCKEYTEVFRISKIICQRFCKSSKTSL